MANEDRRPISYRAPDEVVAFAEFGSSYAALCRAETAHSVRLESPRCRSPAAIPAGLSVVFLAGSDPKLLPAGRRCAVLVLQSGFSGVCGLVQCATCSAEGLAGVRTRARPSTSRAHSCDMCDVWYSQCLLLSEARRPRLELSVSTTADLPRSDLSPEASQFQLRQDLQRHRVRVQVHDTITHVRLDTDPSSDDTTIPTGARLTPTRPFSAPAASSSGPARPPRAQTWS